jgi:RNA polymerase sigma factor (sigma-70 family)
MPFRLPAILDHVLRGLPATTGDAALLCRYATDRDADAFRALVARHGPLVLGVCKRVLDDDHKAEDAFQATFLVLALRAGSIRRPAGLAAWLFGVARRTALKAKRTDRRRARRECAATPPKSVEPHDDLSARELLAALDEELDRLPLGYREPLVLCYWQGLTQDQAARRLGCTAGAIKGRLERGRARLAERLRRRGFGPATMLLAPIATAAVPREVLARTVELAAAPWSGAVPAAVLSLAAGPSKLLPMAGLVMLLGTGGLLALAIGGTPAVGDGPVADASGSQVNAAPAVDRYGDPLPRGAVTRLGSLRFRSDDNITHPIVLPSAKEVVFAAGPAVVVMDLDTGKVVRRVGRALAPDVLNSPGHALAVTPDGRTFAAGWRGYASDGKTPMTSWTGDLKTGRILREFAGNDRPVNALAFVSDGRSLASLDSDGVVTIWNVATGVKVRAIRAPKTKFTSLAASPDGKTFAAGEEAKDGGAAVYLWDVGSGNLLHILRGHTGSVKAIAFSPDGRTLATGGNAIIHVWDVASGRETRQLRGHAAKRGDFNFSIEVLAFSPDGNRLASASNDWTVRVWAVATGQPIDEAWIGVAGDSLAFRDDRTLLIGGGYGLLFRDVIRRKFPEQLHSRYFMYFANFAADGRRIVTGSCDSGICVWDAADGRRLSQDRRADQSVIMPLVAPGGDWVAYSDGDVGHLVTCVWHLRADRVVKLSGVDQHPGTVSADGRMLMTFKGSESEKPDDDFLSVWDAATGALVSRLKTGRVNFEQTALGPNGRYFFAAQMEQPYRLRQWEVATGRLVRAIDTGGAGMRGLAASTGGRRVAAMGCRGSVSLWDTATGRECWRSTVSQGRGGFSDVVSFSADGSLLATDNHTAEILLWDARTGKPLATLPGHGKQLNRLAFSPDGRRLVSTSQDGTALVWDIEAAIGHRIVSILDPIRQTELWADLAGGDGLGAHAIDCLQANPTAALTILKAQLRPAVAMPAERVAPLLAGLDDSAFAAREKAQRELAALGPAAEPNVAAARDRANAEVRRRIDAVLAGWEAGQRRLSRAVEVLEYIATPGARQLLTELAGGDPQARLTKEAKAALGRLGGRT